MRYVNRATALKLLDATAGWLLCKLIGWLRHVFRRPALAPNPKPSSVRRILLVRPGGMGDMLMLLPVIRHLSRHLPGVLMDIVCEKLNEKQVEYIDVNTWGWVNPHFMGSAVVSAVFWEHDVFDENGQFTRNLVGLGGVIVERIGGTQGQPDIPGDESKAVGMFPVYDFFQPEREVSCPGIPPNLSP